MTDRSAASAPARAPLSGLDGWNAAWLAALALGAGLLMVSPIALGGSALWALAVMALPALAGLAVSRGRAGGAEPAILALWAVCGLVATLLTGGVAGPVGVWMLSPLAAAAAMAKPQRLALGAALAVGTLALSLLATFTLYLPHPPQFAQAWPLGTIALATTCVALGVALVALQREVERERAETRRATAQMRDALSEQPDLLVAINPGGRVLGAWGQALGVRGAGGLVDHQITQLSTEADRGHLQAAVARALETGSALVRFTGAGGAPGGLEMVLRRANASRLVGAVRDVRHQAQREVELERARLDAETQNAGKSRFLANMSHELRTPLNAIMGFADIMRQKLFGALPDRYAEYPELIHESGGHLLELINDVLDMSKIEAERFELNREEFDARDAVYAVLRLMRGQADRAGVSLRGVVPREALEVNADRRAVKQIALNLISNALKFTPKDGVVTVTAQADGPDLELIVSDTGPGIAPEDLARLGRPYEQTADGMSKAEGTGLGLSLVKAFAELHGGELRLESELGEGTTAIVRMPVMEAAKVEA